MENQTSQSAAAQPSQPDENAISMSDVLDKLIVIAESKNVIIGLTFVVALIAAGVSLWLPNIYTATSKVLPPQSNQSGASNALMLSQLGVLGAGAGAALGLKDPNGLYVAMLKSRNISEKVARRFDLQRVYETKTMTDTLKMLEKSSSITAGKDGVITVEVDDQDPERAAGMANQYIEELNKLMQNLALTEAAQRRKFFEIQMKPAKDKLTDAEILLDKTPRTSLQYLDAVRNFKYQEAMYEILVKQFEMAKLDEAKDSPLIQVLDKATPPENKSKPLRTKIVLIASLVAFILAVIWIFLREGFLRTQPEPDRAARLMTLRNALKLRIK